MGCWQISPAFSYNAETASKSHGSCTGQMRHERRELASPKRWPSELQIAERLIKPPATDESPLLPSRKPQIGHSALIAIARVCISDLCLCLGQLRLRQIRNAAQAHLVAGLGQFQGSVGLIE